MITVPPWFERLRRQLKGDELTPLDCGGAGHLMTRVTANGWDVKPPLEPVIIKVKVPTGAEGPGLIVSVELPEVVEVVTGLGLKLALVLDGSPLTLRVTELDIPFDTVIFTA